MAADFDVELNRVVALAAQLPGVGNRFQLMIMLGTLARLSAKLHQRMRDEYARGGKQRRAKGDGPSLIAAAKALKAAMR